MLFFRRRGVVALTGATCVKLGAYVSRSERHTNNVQLIYDAELDRLIMNSNENKVTRPWGRLLFVTRFLPSENKVYTPTYNYADMLMFKLNVKQITVIGINRCSAKYSAGISVSDARRNSAGISVADAWLNSAGISVSDARLNSADIMCFRCSAK